MSKNSKRPFSIRRSVRRSFSRAANLLLSASLVVAMTVWATSSPFSPLSQRSDLETAHESVSLLQKVQTLFDVSESVLPSPMVRPVVLKVDGQDNTAFEEEAKDLAERSDADDQSRLKETYALRQQDRAAWLSFRRQDSLLMMKPVVGGIELPLNKDVAIEATDLPEVHFSSAELQPVPIQPEERQLETVAQLPIQLGLPGDENSIEEEQPIAKEQPKVVPDEVLPTRIANLPDIPYIAPFGNSKLQNGVQPTLPAAPQQKSWETGLY